MEITLIIDGKSFTAPLNGKDLEKAITNACAEARNKYLHSIKYGRYA